MRKSKFLIQSTRVIIFGFVLLVGCSARTAAVPTVSQSIPTQPVNTLIEQTITRSPTTTQTEIATKTPELATNSPTVTPSWTKLPTFLSEEAISLSDKLLRTNADCLLPCWWGFIPGETKWQDARRFLEQIAIKISDTEYQGTVYGEVIIPVPEEISPAALRQKYRIRNGVIEEIEIPFTGLVQIYSLSTFLEMYGKPEEVWVRTYSTDYKGYLPFEYALFYPNGGTLAIYYDTEAMVNGDIVLGCPQRTPGAFLGLWEPNRNMKFEEAIRMFSWYYADWDFIPIEQATNFDIDTFFEVFLEPENVICIETPSEMWPEQQ